MVDEVKGDFEVVSVYTGVSNRPIKIRDILWPRGNKAVDVPLCGFTGSDCKDSGLCRKLKLEAALANMTWEVKWEELHFPQQTRVSWVASRSSLTSMGTTVAVKRLPTNQKRPEMVRPILMEIKMVKRTFRMMTLSLRRYVQVREAQHPNLARFIGLCIEPPNVAIITEFCPRGSLQDVLRNESLKLDWIFKYSLMSDIIKGMYYIHNSEIRVHGRLSSSNCVVDSHFVLKLTDFGLPSFREDYTINFNSKSTYVPKYIRIKFPLAQKFSSMWRVGEAVQVRDCPVVRCREPRAATKGDVYSFSIIAQEIVTREEPFHPFCGLLDHLDIVQRVVRSERPPFRPQLEPVSCSIELMQLLERCWAEDPGERPDFHTVRAEMHAIVKVEHGDVNIMENLLTRMAQYANNLEVLVEQRTEAFHEEKRRSEKLLYQVLPRSVAEQLKQGKAAQPELFQSVTIYFSDIVGFTALCSVSTPMQVVDFLNDLYTCFDAIVSDYDAYKVETIGDAYMVVSGLPDRNGTRHAPEVARLALALLKASRQFRIRHRPQDRLRLRIGLHSGPCCAGVVGRKMPRYCLFGDTVNTASRMESTGERKFHVTT
ncbi:NPR2 [Cordylochernes scorpioides]|uniref:Guanylate cyclase n=1 Tax=Cordylochernes scorpioides TaxID=51811 RepID=A0ABY6LQD6_9ARAC|nr:NPR2 [Cordylochernes scorpioides]